MEAKLDDTAQEQGDATGRGRDTERLAELVQRAQQGDLTALPLLREALEADPALWQEYGDLAAQAQEAWLQLLAGTDYLLAESVRLKLGALRRELGAEGASPLEKLLIERIVACWLQTHYADALYAQARGPHSTPSVRQELMKRQESSQRRYLAAIKQLALVRKLLKPALSPLQLALGAVGEERATPKRQTTVAAPQPSNRGGGDFIRGGTAARISLDGPPRRGMMGADTPAGEAAKRPC
jgi:hypothetical protein